MLKTLSNFKPLLQSDYGKDMDCSLTSITACIFYYADDITYDFKDADMKCKNIYDNIVALAENCCYNGDTYGMIPFFIKKVYNWGLSVFNPDGYKRTKSAYLKGVGFNYKTICDAIDHDMPVILSMFRCGKYHNHTVSVIGYMSTTKQLIIYDNWTRAQQCIKYDDISFISCINY